MPESFTIRPATLADVPTIVAHRRAMFEAMGYADRDALDAMDEKFGAWAREKIAAGAYRHWFALNERNAIVAGAGLWLLEWPAHPRDQSGRRGNLLNVYTLPDFRRRGLARQLTTMILEWCRERGLRSVFLNASDEGRPLYTALGFAPTNEMRIQLQGK